jgi:L-malate glycosyltransferase
MRARPIHIALVIDFIDHSMGGTERQLLLLAKSLDRKRFRTSLVCLRPTLWQRENQGDFDIHTFPGTRFASPRTWLEMLRLIRFLRRERIDIVQTHFRTGNTVGMLCGFLAGRRVLISTRRGTAYWHDRLGLGFLRFLNSLATGFIANSRWAARHLVEREKVAQGKVRIIRNGLPDPVRGGAPAGERAEILRGRGLDPTHRHVVAVGNLRPVKRHDVLIRSAAGILRGCPDARFLVVGDGALRTELAALADELGVAHAVRFLGRQHDVIRLLAACDVGVLCSDSESQSNAIIEYMAAGLPVVCTDVGGNPELVTEGVNGFLVPAGDAGATADRILRLLTDRALATRMGSESRRIAAEAFSLEAMVGATAAYYEEILGPG